MPRTPWGRRHISDSPRPAGRGRRWAGRLRRSGSLARQVLAVRVGRRRAGLATQGSTIGQAAVVTLPGALDTGPEPPAGQRPGDPGWPAGAPLARVVAPLGQIPSPTLAPPSGWSLPSPTVIPPGVEPGADRLQPDRLQPDRLRPDRLRPGTDHFATDHLATDHLATDRGAGEPGAGPATARLKPLPLLPGEPTLARRIRFAAVNGCTMGSLVLGMSAIFLSMHGGVRWAALCLVGCVTFDGLDGALARRLGVSSPFGAQMDSLADMCSFGIAAPVVVYASMHGTGQTPLVAGACVLVAACSAVRLARFNVSPKDGRFFCGVPTTMAAAVLGLAILIGLRPPGTVAVAAIAVLALAMVSGFPYAKLARIVKLPPWLWLAPAVGAFLDYRITFAALVALYLASGPMLWLRQRS